MDKLISPILEYRYYIEILAIVIASLTALSGIDDVFVDIYYWCLKLFGKQDAKDLALARTLQAEVDLPERPFAIMVPAWHEQDVIYAMLTTNTRLLAYRNYIYFIGVYQNDHATTAEVKRARALHTNIQIVIVPRDGPTSKADCLNVLSVAIREYEEKIGSEFAGITLHDAEDFIHPHEFKVFNSLIGEYDFVQLPVYSFSQSFGDVVGGIYMDEFAEVHTKDLLVRKHMSGLIPCAGVSACFSRKAVIALAENNQGRVFQTASFTEDYDIAFRLRALALKTTFVSCPVNYTIDMDHEIIAPVYLNRTPPISTREFFPSKFGQAARQRARWLIGIVFQGTSTHGWKGNWGTKYFLLRDRKGIFNGPTIVLGYFAMVNLLLIGMYLVRYGHGARFDYIFLSRNYVVDLFIVNIIFLLWRLAHRVLFTARIYNLRHGLLAVPRLVVANFVNFFAATRATRTYLGHLVTGTPLIWDKTSHSYPVRLRIETEPPSADSHPLNPSNGPTDGAAPESTRELAVEVTP